MLTDDEKNLLLDLQEIPNSMFDDLHTAFEDLKNLISSDELSHELKLEIALNFTRIVIQMQRFSNSAYLELEQILIRDFPEIYLPDDGN